MKIHENRQIQLEADLRTTRQVLNEAYREKHELEKQSEVEIETLKFEVHTLNSEFVFLFGVYLVYLNCYLWRLCRNGYLFYIRVN